MDDTRPSAELLESVHVFPGTYRFKAIGATADDFEGRVVAAVTSVLVSPSEMDYSARSTAGKRHIALTFDVTVQTAEQVREIYARVRQVSGLQLLL